MMRNVALATAFALLCASPALAGSDDEYECKLPEKYLCGDNDEDKERGKRHGQEKIAVCHDGNTLFLPRPAVQAHLRHGDRPGECKGRPRSA